MKQRISVNGCNLTLEQVELVAREHAQAELSDQARQAMESSHRYVMELIRQQKPVYGITTGFGKFCDIYIKDENLTELQHNLIRSHSCGVGSALPAGEVRAMMLLRANALALGNSGVRPLLVDTLLQCLNKNVLPVVPSKGSLGASGDLVPLAHMGLFLIGEGQATYQGKEMPADQALSTAGVEPLKLEAKEGLALVNGTQFMAARGVMLLQSAHRLALAADAIAAMTCEVLRGIPDAYSELISQVRKHPGQQRSAANLRKFLDGSRLTSEPGQLRIQDAYALRCVPQVHGASLDVLDYVSGVLQREVNSATDNPLIFPDSDQVISGGNFHGQPLALSLDFVAIALAEFTSISERRIERMVNPQLSNGLPAFLTDNGGLNSGLMILQYVAAALTSENKTLCHPASVDSIPSSGNQEDHVSMGANAANKAWQVWENLSQVLAIELLCACQAADYRGIHLLSPNGKKLYDCVRSSVPYIEKDRSFHKDLSVLKELLASGEISAILNQEE